MGKIKYGIEQGFYATIAPTGDAYETPTPLVGSTKFAYSESGDPTNIYADDIVYCTLPAQKTISCTYDTLYPEADFEAVCMGMSTNANGVVTSGGITKPIAFGFITNIYDGDTGDQKRELYVFYKLTAGSTSWEVDTTSDSTTNATLSLPFNAGMSFVEDDAGQKIVYMKLTETEENKAYFDGKLWLDEIPTPQSTFLDAGTGPADTNAPVITVTSNAITVSVGTTVDKAYQIASNGLVVTDDIDLDITSTSKVTCSTVDTSLAGSATQTITAKDAVNNTSTEDIAITVE